jgi:hypothetical protein
MMKLTYPGKDYIIINEENLKDEKLLEISKIHLIHFCFAEPTREKINGVLQLFNKTNRFVISNNIKLYNDVLKLTAKKYYVMNNVGDNLITFFRKNNKVLLNFSNLSQREREFVCSSDVVNDILKNVEVIQMKKSSFSKVKDLFDLWDGNIILCDD